MSVVRAFDHFVSSRHDGACQALVDQAKLEIGKRRGLLDHGERLDQGQRHALLADPEISARALGLRAPIPVGRYLDEAKGIGFHARCSWWTARRVLAHVHTYFSVSATFRNNHESGRLHVPIGSALARL